jgi:hypothetical protein
MPLDEILDSLREVPQLQIAARPDLPGDISGHIPRPAFHGVESEDPDWPSSRSWWRSQVDEKSHGSFVNLTTTCEHQNGGCEYSRAANAGGLLQSSYLLPQR